MRPAALAGMVAAGIPLGVAIEKSGSRPHPLVDLAIRVGAPLTPALTLLEQQLQARDRISSEVFQAQAVPRTTRKLLLWLPLLSVLLGEAMGLKTISGLLTPVGLLALSLALLVLWIGSKVTARMLSQLRDPDCQETEELMALDLCLMAGVGLGEIQNQLGLKLESAAVSMIELSKSTGASLRPLIATEILRLNQQELDAQLSKAKRLSVSLLIPLSLTTLPAFLLLTIPPMLIGITQ